MAASSGRLASFCFFVCLFVWFIPPWPWFGVEIVSRFVGVLFSIAIAYHLSAYLPPNNRLPATNKAVLVTGCDTGIGHALAIHLDSIGFNVFAGCLFKDGAGARKLKESASERLTILQLDVTNDKQVKQAADNVRKSLNDKVFWGVVNNAGLIRYGEAEWIPADMFHKVQDVNVWGLIRVTQAFLPLLRHSKGRVVNISSIAGRFSAAMSAPYFVSKHCVEVISDIFRHELMKWGIKVVIIEPGNFGSATEMCKKDAVTKNLREVWDRVSDEVKADYGEQYLNHLTTFLASTADHSSGDLRPVLEAITDGLTLAHPSERYMCAGVLWKIMIWTFTLLPSGIMDHLIHLAEIPLIGKLPKKRYKIE